jgi:hypothetical protein
VQAHLDGVGADAEGLGRFLGGEALDVAQQQHAAAGLGRKVDLLAHPREEAVAIDLVDGVGVPGRARSRGPKAPALRGPRAALPGAASR